MAKATGNKNATTVPVVSENVQSFLAKHDIMIEDYLPATAGTVSAAFRIVNRKGADLSPDGKVSIVVTMFDGHMASDKVKNVIAKSDESAKKALAMAAVEKARQEFATISAPYASKVSEHIKRATALKAELANIDASVLATRTELAEKIGTDVSNIVMGENGFLFAPSEKKGKKASGVGGTRNSHTYDYSPVLSGVAKARATWGKVEFKDILLKGENVQPNGKGEYILTGTVAKTGNVFTVSASALSTVVDKLARKGQADTGAAVEGASVRGPKEFGLTEITAD